MNDTAFVGVVIINSGQSNGFADALLFAINNHNVPVA
jgi:hypothetical protein